MLGSQSTTGLTSSGPQTEVKDYPASLMCSQHIFFGFLGLDYLYPNSSRCWVGINSIHWLKIPLPSGINLAPYYFETILQDVALVSSPVGKVLVKQDFFFCKPDLFFVSVLSLIADQ